MKSSSLMLAACITMLSVTGHAQSSADSANEVMKGCRAFIDLRLSEIFYQGICSGAVMALLQFDSSFGICFPGDSTVNQAVRVVVAYIDAKPARLHENFNRLALEALKDAWPCKR
jgi:Rap1a immunity proteins